MNFRDKIIEEINANKEYENQRRLDGEKQKNEDINRIIEKLIDRAKMSFNKDKPEKDYKPNWLGIKVYTGHNFLSGGIKLWTKPKSTNYNKIDFVKDSYFNYYHTDSIYADEEDVRIIRQRLNEWFRENEIEIASYKSLENGGFEYRLKIYID